MGEHFDVVLVGAGISGIGAACHLQMKSPDRSFVILEGRSDIGGTWDLFRYPGVRSDSDMNTLGFEFKPWTDDKAIAEGPAIMDYLRETVAEYDVERHIRFGHHVERAEWSTETSTWTVHTWHVDTGAAASFTCNFLFMGSGYYSYEEGYLPDLPGRDRFQGQVVHPQFWPEDLDYRDRRVIVIGSGATAITLLPAMAPDVSRITMLQRSPTYVVSAPEVDRVATFLRRWLPAHLAYRLIRRKNAFLQVFWYRQTRIRPDWVKGRLLKAVRKGLGPDYDVERHFTPSYNPWDERMCLIPDGDLFEAINSGKADVVTGEIETFTETGIQLKSGEHLEADVIVTATGLKMLSLGGVEVVVDSEVVDFADTWTYKGLAFSDVPNLVASFGFVNASWTLRADMISDYVCRLLNHMAATGTTQCTPRLRASDEGMPELPLFLDFQPGYIARALPTLPKQSDREPWVNTQLYPKDVKLIRRAPVADGVMRFTGPRTPAAKIPETEYV